MKQTDIVIIILVIAVVGLGAYVVSQANFNPQPSAVQVHQPPARIEYRTVHVHHHHYKIEKIEGNGITLANHGTIENKFEQCPALLS